jgi:type IV pilus assembly protein PilM
MPLSGNKQKKRDDIVAIDLGTQLTKAVYLRRKGGEFSLQNYVLLATPIYEKVPTREMLAEHFKQVCRSLRAGTKRAVIVVGTTDSFLCHAELPAASLSELRRMIKLSPKVHLRQDLPDHVFDCYVTEQEPANTETAIIRARRKQKVLVAAVRRRWIENLQEAAGDAGLFLEQITLSQVGCVNAFKMLPAESHADAVALLDIGMMNSTISIVAKGDFPLTRVVNIGAKKISEALSKLGAGEEPVEEVKDDAGEEVEARLQRSIGLVAKELLASISFFETQQDLKVTQVFVSGGAARSQFVLQTLERELELPCESWNPTKSVAVDLQAPRRFEVEYDGPQLSVALGGGLAYLNPNLLTINLLAQEQEDVELRRQDPIRRARWASAAIALLMLGWTGFLGAKLWLFNADLKDHQVAQQTLEKNSSQPIAKARMAREVDQTLTTLKRLGANRFLWAPTLNALQYTTLPGIQLQDVQVDQFIISDSPAVGSGPDNKPGHVTERIVMTIRGKNYGDLQVIDKLVEAIATHPYFKQTLRSTDPISVKRVDRRQVDPTAFNRAFNQFQIECTFADRVLKHE